VILGFVLSTMVPVRRKSDQREPRSLPDPFKVKNLYGTLLSLFRKLEIIAKTTVEYYSMCQSYGTFRHLGLGKIKLGCWLIVPIEHYLTE